MARKRSEHYVNNKEFLAAIVEYKEKVALAAERGEAKPRITIIFGECFLKIALIYPLNLTCKLYV